MFSQYGGHRKAHSLPISSSSSVMEILQAPTHYHELFWYAFKTFKNWDFGFTISNKDRKD